MYIYSTTAKPSINLPISLLASEKISENLHIVGNEPSLAFYRIQEHVRKIVPVIVERQSDVAGLQQDLQGHAYDIEYALG